MVLSKEDRREVVFQDAAHIYKIDTTQKQLFLNGTLTTTVKLALTVSPQTPPSAHRLQPLPMLYQPICKVIIGETLDLYSIGHEFNPAEAMAFSLPFMIFITVRREAMNLPYTTSFFLCV